MLEKSKMKDWIIKQFVDMRKFVKKAWTAYREQFDKNNCEDEYD